jgi:Tfp pilus assembly protein PilF
MRRVWWLVGLLVCLGGCASEQQERLRTYNTEGVTLFQRGEYAAARQNFEAALQLQPDDAGLRYNVGQCCDRLGDAAGAERAYTACLQVAPEHAPCRHALCRLLVRDGRTPDAVRLVDEWLQKQPNAAGPYAADGWLWFQAGDLPRAQGRLQQALERDPHDVQALLQLAQVYEATHRPERAVVLYERALRQDPQQPDVVRRLDALRSQGAGPPRPDQ